MWRTDVATVGNLTLNNNKIVRYSGGASSAYAVAVNASATIKRLVLNGFAIENAYGSSVAATAKLIDIPSGGAVTTLIVNRQDPANITALLSSGSAARVTNVMGDLLPSMLVADLPTCNAASEAARSAVTDALTPVALSTVAGSGAVKVAVRCDGTNWVVQ
jgi:hypothetical protein